ncbi:hypothetical protein BKA62DRAFT_690141 [Auriculariales sp. MPI-PUGE-AT-0066]|nr:hypothetical protein BKA62DRAFT_690141 [Auriculariales sp. MPI-PUGE-AT-0066]
MTKTDSRFEATVALPWDEEVVYKYIVDGQWVVSDQEPKKDDGSGQLNNVYRSPKATEPAGAADAPTATPEVQPETVAAPVIVSETAVRATHVMTIHCITFTPEGANF